MNINTPEQPEVATDLAATSTLTGEELSPAKSPSRNKKRNFIIGGSLAALLVAGSAIAAPYAIHASQVGKYHEASDQLEQVYQAQAVAQDDALFGGALAWMQQQESVKFVGVLAKIAEAPADVIAEKDAKKFAEVGAALVAELGEEPKVTSEQADAIGIVEVKIAKIVEARTAASPTDAQKELAKQEFPASFLTATPADIDTFVGGNTTPTFTRVAETDVNGDVLAEIESKLASETKKLKKFESEAADITKERARILAAIADTRDLLTDTALTLPELAATATAASPKAGDTITQTLAAATSASDFAKATEFTLDENESIVPVAVVAVAEPAGDENADTGEQVTPDAVDLVDVTDEAAALTLSAKIGTYIDLVAALKQAHASAVAAEAAAASGGGWSNTDDGWSDDGGGWSGNGGGWTGGGSTGGGSTGGGSTGGGSTGGGSTGGGSTGGGSDCPAGSYWNPDMGMCWTDRDW